MPSKAESLRVDALEVRFGGVRAVDGASLSVAEGEIVALLGPSGCGKTTLLRTVAGFERAWGGEIRLGGELIESARVSVPPHRRDAGLVFQEYALFPHKTVAANIAYGLPRGGDRSVRVRELLALGGLEGFEDRYPHQLSGGQQQRVAVLRSLAPRPRVLLLDEPFSNLDPGLRVEMRDQVARLLRAEGVSAVLVTHDRTDAMALADRVAVMEAGKILQVGTPAALYFEPVSERVAGLAGEVQFLDGTVEDGTVETALGPLRPLGTPAAGSCRVLVRPEWVIPCMGGGAPARIVSSRMEGQHVRYRIRVRGGAELAMTTASGLPLPPDDEITVRVHVPVPVFPAGS
ncbi:MAG: ABC transporter ATP-binding protein [Dehalococcoidia bacterium]|nr:ABC transporter ATP-binding protein [Dehalococcoidia bacterium]